MGCYIAKCKQVNVSSEFLFSCILFPLLNFSWNCQVGYIFTLTITFVSNISSFNHSTFNHFTQLFNHFFFFKCLGLKIIMQKRKTNCSRKVMSRVGAVHEKNNAQVSQIFARHFKRATFYLFNVIRVSPTYRYLDCG